ncbi:hypothetical protein HIM_10944 [Hirsutella minnesotensis 3608]|uniref:Uncharacterized protein n=1 Tax=Hirsutella minnesotensis 3608 TaxID=1043627 RepID=A0A0F7ZFS9_9HYPO|nr:hypothetical protein HIM_10944 [Hirsutella minnesotensis 3608]
MKYQLLTMAAALLTGTIAASMDSTATECRPKHPKDMSPQQIKDGCYEKQAACCGLLGVKKRDVQAAEGGGGLLSADYEQQFCTVCFGEGRIKCDGREATLLGLSS